MDITVAFPSFIRFQGSIPSRGAKGNMIEKVDPKFVSDVYQERSSKTSHQCCKKDAWSGDIYHIDEKAFVCLAYLDRVPADEETLLSANIGPVVLHIQYGHLRKEWVEKLS